MLICGQLSRYFKGTGIEFFEDLDIAELDTWIQVMNESARREEAAMKRAMKG